MSKPIENFYKKIFIRAYTYKQHQQTEKNAFQSKFAASFMHLELGRIKEGTKEDYKNVGESQVGIILQDHW